MFTFVIILVLISITAFLSGIIAKLLAVIVAGALIFFCGPALILLYLAGCAIYVRLRRKARIQ